MKSDFSEAPSAGSDTLQLYELDPRRRGDKGQVPKILCDVRVLSVSMSSLPPPGSGYFVEPVGGAGPAVLLLHSGWGLTDDIRAKARELAQAGFSVLAPDLCDGEVADSPDQAHELLLAADMNVTASLVQSALRLVRAAAADPLAPAGIVGYSSGASWGLWLSERLADQCTAVVGFYGTQSISFSDSLSSYLLHFAADDELVTDDEVALLGLNLQMSGQPFRFEQHADVSHGFAESPNPAFSAGVEAIAWRQTLEFLATELIGAAR